MEKISIIIPAYNEEKRGLDKTLEEYCRFFREIKRKKEIQNFELLVVINGCKDNTRGVVENMQKKFKEIIYIEFERAGKGFAVIEGFKNAARRDNSLIGSVDADMSAKPESFYNLMKNIGSYDGIMGNRDMKESVVDTSFKRKLTHRGFNFVIRTLFLMPYSDTQCGAKLFRKEAIEKVVDKIGITLWAWDIDFLYNLRKRGFRIKESPIVWEDKESCSAMDLIRTSIQMFSGVVRLRVIHSPFRKIINLYDRLPEGIKFHKW